MASPRLTAQKAFPHNKNCVHIIPHPSISTQPDRAKHLIEGFSNIGFVQRIVESVGLWTLELHPNADFDTALNEIELAVLQRTAADGEPDLTVELDHEIAPCVQPEDKLYPRQHNSLGIISAETAWSKWTTAAPVAVLDTGIFAHPDLEGSLNDEVLVDYHDVGTDTSQVGHGTRCAGIIGADWNKRGIRGIAEGDPATKRKFLYDIPVINGDRGTVRRVWEALDAFKDALPKTISPTKGVVLMAWALRTENLVIKTAIQKYSSQFLFVCAAGNDGRRLGTVQQSGEAMPVMRYPACYGGNASGYLDSVVTVGAVVNEADVANFSNTGYDYGQQSYVDLFAPGSQVLSTTPFVQGSPKYGRAGGTSFAAAHVAAAAAMLFSKNPGWTPLRVKQELQKHYTRTLACVSGEVLNLAKLFP